MRETGLERVAGLGSNGGRGVLRETGDLSPDTRVAELVAMSGLRSPLELGVSTAQDLLVACPALEGRASEAVELELEIWVAEDGAVEGEGVGGSCAGSERTVGIQCLGAAEEVSELRVDVGISFGRSDFGTGLDGV